MEKVLQCDTSFDYQTMYNLYIMETAHSFTRTQIYLTQTQQKRLDAASRHSSTTKSELIRRAVDQFLDQQAPADPVNKAQRLSGIVGMWAQRDEVSDPAAYVRALRAPRF